MIVVTVQQFAVLLAVAELVVAHQRHRVEEGDLRIFLLQLFDHCEIVAVALVDQRARVGAGFEGHRPRAEHEGAVQDAVRRLEAELRHIDDEHDVLAGLEEQLDGA